jgi:uncharacterized protein (DUF58 family)
LKKGLLPVPAPGLGLALLVPAALFAAAVAFPSLAPAAGLADAAILALAAVDLMLGLGLARPLLRLPSELSVPVGRPAAIQGSLANPGRRGLRLRLRLDMPDEYAERREELRLSLAPGAEVSLSFAFRPLRRGRSLLGPARLRWASPLGLFWIQSDEGEPLTCSVLPRLDMLRRRARAARGLAVLAAGSRIFARRSGEAELDYLRDYRQDDDSRRIDWKASLRVGRTVSKVMRSETSRHVVVALDCGRGMLAEQEGVSSLDHAASALMALAQAAFEAGDSLSAIAFADTILAELPAISGRNGSRRVAAFLSGLEALQAESNYEIPLERLMRGQRKRSLVILITDLSDGSYVALFKRAFGLIARRHLPLIVLLRDLVVQERSEEAPARGEDPAREFSRVAARQMAMDRERAISYLRASGILVLDVLPGELSAALADRYLDLKSRGAL